MSIDSHTTVSPKNKKILGQAQKIAEPISVAVINPTSGESLQGALLAAEQNLIKPTFIGPITTMQAAAKKLGKNIAVKNCIEAATEVEAAQVAIKLAKENKTQALMKGDIHTDTLMSLVVARDTGLRTKRRLSHCMIVDIPTYEKIAIFTDAVVNIMPDLATKKNIIENAIDLAQALSIKIPRIAILAAVETITESIPATIDAAILSHMATRNQIKNCIIDGPLSIDLAVTPKAAIDKHFKPVLDEKPDIFVVPDLNSGNIAIKILDNLANGQNAGLVLGAKVPIILMSRSSVASEHLISCALAKLYVNNK